MTKSANHNLIKKKAIGGFAYLMGRETMLKVIAIFGQLFLVRLLTPEIFGVFAILTFIISFVELFTDLGFSMSIIQSKESLNQKQLSTIFYLKLLLTSAAFTLLYFFTPYIVKIYSGFGSHEIFILRLMYIVLFIRALRLVILSIIERSLNYKFLSGIDLLGMGAYYLIAITLAFSGHGIWSFVWATIIKESLESLVSLIYSKWTPKLYFDIKSIKKLIKVGIYYQMSNITGTIHRATIPLVAGILSTPYYVGLLDWSSNVASIPRTVSENVGRVSFASFSKFQDDKEAISNYLNKTFPIVCFFALYFVIIVLSFGGELIKLLLTEKWLPALPALHWFVAATFFLNGTALLGNVILAMGKTKIMFVSSLFVITLEYFLSVVFFQRFGFIGIPISNFIVLVLMFIYLIILIRHYGINVRFGSNLIIFLLIALLILGESYLLNSFLNENYVNLFIKIIIESISYLVFFYLLIPKTTREALSMAGKFKHSFIK